MKLYILRHEDRTQDATFFSPLTLLGLENSEKISEYLIQNKINFTQIYSSPFVRTLQTINPYCKEKNIKIKLEYGLAEIQSNKLIPCNSFQVRLPEYMAEIFNYDSKYKSIIEPEHFEYPENEKHVSKRIKIVLSNIIEKYGNTNENILFVTHGAICNEIMKIIYKSYSLIKPKKEIINKYPIGSLTLILDQECWTFIPQNWKY